MGPNEWADLMCSEKVTYIALAVCGITAIACGVIITIREVLSISYKKYFKQTKKGGV